MEGPSREKDRVLWEQLMVAAGPALGIGGLLKGDIRAQVCPGTEGEHCKEPFRLRGQHGTQPKRGSVWANQGLHAVKRLGSEWRREAEEQGMRTRQ